jgi:hypothetical protein
VNELQNRPLVGKVSKGIFFHCAAPLP